MLVPSDIKRLATYGYDDNAKDNGDNGDGIALALEIAMTLVTTMMMTLVFS